MGGEGESRGRSGREQNMQARLDEPSAVDGMSKDGSHGIRKCLRGTPVIVSSVDRDVLRV